MKHTKYIVIDNDGYNNNCLLDMPLGLFTSKKEAKECAKAYTEQEKQYQEELSHQDIAIGCLTYHVYKVERID